MFNPIRLKSNLTAYVVRVYHFSDIKIAQNFFTRSELSLSLVYAPYEFTLKHILH